MDNTKVLVTGGSGFVGSATIRAIHAAHPTWTLYNLDVRPPNAAHESTAQWIEGDITSSSSVTAAILSCLPDAIIHTAGWVPNGQLRYSWRPSVKDKVFSINVSGTSHVISAAREAGTVKALVHTSSCTVISDDLEHDYPLMRETLPTGNATVVYGSSKTQAENMVLAADSEEMATCALRPATVIGPGDSYGVIGTIYSLVDNGETPFVIGDGHNLYDFVYIDNVAEAHLLALENLLSSERTAKGLAMFISNQEPVYFRDFMETIWAQVGGHVAPYKVHIPGSLAWLMGMVAEGLSWVTGREAALSRGAVQDAIGTRYSDNARAIKLLGYKPKVGFADAVRIACEDYKRQRAAGRQKS